MKSFIKFEKVWSDIFAIELQVTVSNGESTFVNKVYCDSEYIEQFRSKLIDFVNHLNTPNIQNLTFGSFGEGYAGGAISLKLDMQNSGKINISINMQSDFFGFGKEDVANEVSLYIKSEPALFQSFIEELKILDGEKGSSAILFGI
jgi:hypothetical protein